MKHTISSTKVKSNSVFFYYKIYFIIFFVSFFISKKKFRILKIHSFYIRPMEVVSTKRASEVGRSISLRPIA